MNKVKTDRSQYIKLEQLPNIGHSIAGDLKLIGISNPHELLEQDPYEMYDKLCRITHSRQDPCVLDTFISAVRFMQGAPKRPWWAYTAERKKVLGKARSKKLGDRIQETA